MFGRWERFPFGGTLVVATLGLLMPAGELPTGVDVWDKLAHAAIFAALALTGRFAGIGPRVLGVALATYAVLTEFLQAVLPIGRSGDSHDLVADGLGIAGGLALGWLFGLMFRART